MLSDGDKAALLRLHMHSQQFYRKYEIEDNVLTRGVR